MSSKSHKMTFVKFHYRKLLKNHVSKIKKSFWSYLATWSKFLPNADKVLSPTRLETFELSANRKISLIKMSDNKALRDTSYYFPQASKIILSLYLWNLPLNNFEQSLMKSVVKQLWTKLNELLSKPHAHNFRNNRERSKVSNAFTNPWEEHSRWVFIQNSFPFFNHNQWSILSAVVFAKTCKMLWKFT